MIKFSATCVFVFVLVLILVLAEGEGQCSPSWCGNMSISYPFRLRGDPPSCGNSRFELACENDNRTTFHPRYLDYLVQEINYSNLTLRFVDTSVYDNANTNCYVPGNSFVPYHSPCYEWYEWYGDYSLSLSLLNCSKPVSSSGYHLVDTSACFAYSYFYALDADLALASDLDESCVVVGTMPIPFPVSNVTDQLSLSNIHRWLLNGFEVSYAEDKISCSSNTFEQRWNTFWREFSWFVLGYKGELITSSATIGGFLTVRTLLGMAFLIAFLIYKCQRRHLSEDNVIEDFLRNNNNLIPIRYSYSEIKKITEGFQHKLGQGGFGSVFKGKLRSGHSVAVKVLLSKSKTNGQDFINEVATIGRIHHVHVVQLIGFCVEGSKQALVYDFMPNSSLDKLLFSEREEGVSMSWLRMHEIALGVARGIEYLHRGCEMQILHFDIKPHNILLDENFVPKVSDFGLAKLHSLDDSIVSLTAVRGTLGYMAPELFYKNIGGVSYKADVYSFGMLLMEMVGRRKNLNVFAQESYDQFDQEEFMELGDNAMDGEKEIVRKIILVALWCIQMNPVNRPSMNKVVEMLEGEVEYLQMPPKPFMHPGEMPIGDQDQTNNMIMEVPMSYNAMDTISLDGR